jgi:hypothetical protein
MTQKQLFQEVRLLGLTISKTCYGEYRLNFKGEGERTACYTQDKEDAMGTAQAMAKEVNLEKEEIQETVPDIFSASKLFRQIIQDSKLSKEDMIQKNLDRMKALKEAKL